MRGIVGIRVAGESRVVFAATGDGIGPLAPGDRVVLETPEGRVKAVVAIGADQFLPGDGDPPVSATIVALDALSHRADPVASREEAIYRARKAGYPPLGSRLETPEISGTVVRTDLRHERVEVQSEGGPTITIALTDLPSSHHDAH